MEEEASLLKSRVRLHATACKLIMENCGGYDFSGKRVLVTGAGKGIGRATVKALVKCGAQVIALSRTQEDLDLLKREVSGVITVCVDVSDIEATKRAVDKQSPIHMLVNNAGFTELQPFLEVTSKAYEEVMGINLKAVLFLSQVVAKGMVERGEGGAIVNVSSLSSLCAIPNHAVYCASKGGLDMLSKVMGLELGPHKIRVNTVNPTVVMTAMGKKAWSDPTKAGAMRSRIPLGRFAEEDEVVKPILFLLSEQSAMINCAVLPIDGGFSAC